MALNELIENKNNLKQQLNSILLEIKLKNSQGLNVSDKCLEYVKLNNILNIEKQIRDIESDPKINEIITYDDILEETSEIP